MNLVSAGFGIEGGLKLNCSGGAAIPHLAGCVAVWLAMWPFGWLSGHRAGCLAIWMAALANQKNKQNIKNKNKQII